eukprot:Nitzschia sp. Nitz4//scaffold378_size14206//9654//11729//NITZ4_008951-RA/size14206-processed-gene-0.16-mRNA-1//-1//CDS//3329549699//5770//frame0
MIYYWCHRWGGGVGPAAAAIMLAWARKSAPEFRCFEWSQPSQSEVEGTLYSLLCDATIASMVYDDSKAMAGFLDDHQPRVVLLFDLDCFYAQCERVRLGLPADVSLALLQWDSVLAVTYPARVFGIQRGDSWQTVATKCPTCWSIHVNVLEKTAVIDDSSAVTPSDTSSMTTTPILDDTVQAAYTRIYQLAPEEQQACQQRENGLRRYHSEGKACLERYRVASMRILQVVLESLHRQLDKDTFSMERASIDEFYLDITEACADEESDSQKMKQAHHIAKTIRQDVWNQLGFTMSAGISVNKMMAKLAASHAKPDGQTLLNPDQFTTVLQKTKLTKVRHFGGKLGSQLVKLLQSRRNKEPRSSVATSSDATYYMGDLQPFSLAFLEERFSPSTAVLIFHSCRGIDHEPVRETSGALVKSITAFKSFAATSCPTTIESWITLLATELVTRIKQDTARNRRVPKTCTLSYAFRPKEEVETEEKKDVDSGKSPTVYNPYAQKEKKTAQRRTRRTTQSVRMMLPCENPQVGPLVKQAMEKLYPVLEKYCVSLAGFSSRNFEYRGHGSATIDSFLQEKSKPFQANKSLTMVSNVPSAICRTKVTRKTRLDEFLSSTQPDDSFANDIEEEADDKQLAWKIHSQQQKQFQQVDEDLALAKRLQASFDREDWIASQTNKRVKQSDTPCRPQRIDTFFGKR